MATELDLRLKVYSTVISLYLPLSASVCHCLYIFAAFSPVGLTSGVAGRGVWGEGGGSGCPDPLSCPVGSTQNVKIR